MIAGARRRTFAQVTTAPVAAGASVTLPAVPLPSIPFLDEQATPARCRKVTVMAAGITGGATTPANWGLAVTVQFQPMKGGPNQAFTLPATAISNLTVIFDLLALPSASLHITCTNNGAAPDFVTISYGGAASPNWTEIETHPHD